MQHAIPYASNCFSLSLSLSSSSATRAIVIIIFPVRFKWSPAQRNYDIYNVISAHMLKIISKWNSEQWLQLVNVLAINE